MRASNRASVAIFRKSFDEIEQSSNPTVPNELFDAAKRVIETHGCELIKTRKGMYIVSYSESGPFQKKISNEWLPVYIAHVYSWSSGGIKKTEMKEFEED